MRFKTIRSIIFLPLLLMIMALPSGAAADTRTIKMSTTTSTENSGLLDVLLPEFAKDTGIQIKVFAKGTGAAIRDGMDGNVDIIFVHAKAREEKFVSEGHGAYRLGVMHNDFVILGPKNDPAGVKGTRHAGSALKKIAEKKALFVSRGDDSGTHTKEQALWKATGLPLKTDKTEIYKKGKKQSITIEYPGGLGQWYLSIGQGMGKTLTFADEKQAYTLADRGTYLKYKLGRPQGLDLEILCEGDPKLHNPYGIIPVNPKRHTHVKFEWANLFAQWLVSPKAQLLIANYKIHNQQAFFPDALPEVTDCKDFYGNSPKIFKLATGSPGELGLLKALVGAFNKEQGTSMCWVKAGSGASLKLLKEKKVDAVMVHAPAAEKKAVQEGWAIKRTLIGSNEFYIVGPKDDPAGISEVKSAAEAFGKIARAKATFLSRGDNSGTHKKELAIWKKAGIEPAGDWYVITRTFMLATLKKADTRHGYFMTDSSTWVAAKKGLKNLAILFRGDPFLINTYHALCHSAGATAGQKYGEEFIDFVASREGQEIIRQYGKDIYGAPMYNDAEYARKYDH
jgi:tungstate transport system substrate-binding protein